MMSPFRLEFETEDYAGRLVCLRTTTWVQHIVPYHPQMFGNQQAIAETLKSPDEVYAQRRANRRNLVYWKRQEIDQLNPWLKVVTKLVDSKRQRYEICTAFTLRDKTAEGDRLWPQP
jgi:hypothetical protein